MWENWQWLAYWMDEDIYRAKQTHVTQLKRRYRKQWQLAAELTIISLLDGWRKLPCNKKPGSQATHLKIRYRKQWKLVAELKWLAFWMDEVRYRAKQTHATHQATAQLLLLPLILLLLLLHRILQLLLLLTLLLQILLLLLLLLRPLRLHILLLQLLLLLLIILLLLPILLLLHLLLLLLVIEARPTARPATVTERATQFSPSLLPS